jgi:hypothetical protein
MRVIKAGIAIVHGRVVEGFRAPFREDAYYDVVLAVTNFSLGVITSEIFFFPSSNTISL